MYLDRLKNSSAADEDALSPIEVSIWSIAEFSPFESFDTTPQAPGLDVKESMVKDRFSDLIETVHTQGDFPGETNDLLANVTLNDNRVVAAFLLKGRSLKAPMTPGNVNKNGDQLRRLFDAPATVFVVQHVHEISETMRKEAMDRTLIKRSQGHTAQIVFVDWRATAKILQL